MKKLYHLGRHALMFAILLIPLIGRGQVYQTTVLDTDDLRVINSDRSDTESGLRLQGPTSAYNILNRRGYGLQITNSNSIGTNYTDLGTVLFTLSTGGLSLPTAKFQANSNGVYTTGLFLDNKGQGC